MSTDNNLSHVPPLTKDGFNDPVWARWLNALQRRVSLSITNLVVAAGQGFAGVVSAVGAEFSIALSTTVSGILKGDAGSLVAATPGTDYLPFMHYAAFHDTTTQTAAAATATTITLNSTDYSQGFTVGSPTSRLVCSATGLYRVNFLVQAENTDAAADNLTVWARLNGTDIVGSAGVNAVPAKHAAINGSSTFGWERDIPFTAGDYIEFVWATDGGTSSIITYAAGAAPVRPSSFGFRVVLQQIAV